ncbi:hypothetical protein FACS1894101_2800 [Betaproteobacteria bacterium]|nr:hypothetical protein FACS1894101_2800 [Betaproteobacteria bacterium]
MNKAIKVADLPEFDAAPYLDSEEAIAAYLTDILTENNPALLAAAYSGASRKASAIASSCVRSLIFSSPAS